MSGEVWGRPLLCRAFKEAGNDDDDDDDDDDDEIKIL